METTAIRGIHHVTAICGDPQRNIDFYTRKLGLRLVKVTVNFDDPASYHFYYGDASGHPGTLLTFFSWPNAHQGQRGSSQATAVALAVPQGSIHYWKQRLAENNVRTGEEGKRFDEQTLTFYDPDGLHLEIVESEVCPAEWCFLQGGVPEDSAICGIHSVTLAENQNEPTLQFATETLGFQIVAQDEHRTRLLIWEAPGGRFLDVLQQDKGPGRIANGTVHHIAYRTDNDASQILWQQRLSEVGTDVSAVMERCYFRSIYFHEPGGVLFEIATDLPGMSVDESLAELGTHLKLPAWLEDTRSTIEKHVMPIRYPSPLQEAE